MVNLLTALPGTQLWRRLEREGRLRGTPSGDSVRAPQLRARRWTSARCSRDTAACSRRCIPPTRTSAAARCTSTRCRSGAAPSRTASATGRSGRSGARCGASASSARAGGSSGGSSRAVSVAGQTSSRVRSPSRSWARASSATRKKSCFRASTPPCRSSKTVIVARTHPRQPPRSRSPERRRPETWADDPSPPVRLTRGAHAPGWPGGASAGVTGSTVRTHRRRCGGSHRRTPSACACAVGLLVTAPPHPSAARAPRPSDARSVPALGAPRPRRAGAISQRRSRPGAVLAAPHEPCLGEHLEVLRDGLARDVPRPRRAARWRAARPRRAAPRARAGSRRRARRTSARRRRLERGRLPVPAPLRPGDMARDVLQLLRPAALVHAERLAASRERDLVESRTRRR